MWRRVQHPVIPIQLDRINYKTFPMMYRIKANNLILKLFMSFYVYAYVACMYVWALCVPGAQRGQKVSDILELEFQKVVRHHIGVGLNLDPLEERPKVLSAERSNSPACSCLL